MIDMCPETLNTTVPTPSSNKNKATPEANSTCRTQQDRARPESSSTKDKKAERQGTRKYETACFFQSNQRQGSNQNVAMQILRKQNIFHNTDHPPKTSSYNNETDLRGGWGFMFYPHGIGSGVLQKLQKQILLRKTKHNNGPRGRGTLTARRRVVGKQAMPWPSFGASQCRQRGFYFLPSTINFR